MMSVAYQAIYESKICLSVRAPRSYVNLVDRLYKAGLDVDGPLIRRITGFAGQILSSSTFNFPLIALPVIVSIILIPLVCTKSKDISLPEAGEAIHIRRQHRMHYLGLSFDITLHVIILLRARFLIIPHLYLLRGSPNSYVQPRLTCVRFERLT